MPGESHSPKSSTRLAGLGRCVAWVVLLVAATAAILPLYWMTRGKKLWQYGPSGYSVWPGITALSTAPTPQLSSIGFENW